MLSSRMLPFATTVLVLLGAVVAGGAFLRRAPSTAVRAGRFVVLAFGWSLLTVLLSRATHLFMGEVAAAWIVALLLWGVTRVIHRMMR